MHKPFVFHRPLNAQLGDNVVPRRNYIESATNHLNSQAVAILDLYSPKRSGKSTFCVQLASYLTANHRNSYPVISKLLQYSAEKSYSRFLNGIFEQIQRELSAVSATSGMSLDLPTLEDHSLEPSRVTHEFLLRVSSIVQYLDRSGTRPYRVPPKIYLILDGTESLQRSVFKSLISGLRLAHHKYDDFRLSEFRDSGISIVLSGTEDLMAVYRREGGTPYSPALRLSLNDFDREEIMFLVTAGFGQLDAAACGYLVKHLVGTAAGHPYLLQKICYVLDRDFSNNIFTPWNIDWKEVESLTSDLSDDNIQMAIDYARDDPGVEAELERLCLEGTTTLVDEQSKVRSKLYASGVISIRGAQLAIRNELYRHMLTKFLAEQRTGGVDRMKIRILFLSANPTNTGQPPLGLINEYKAIDNGIRLSSERDSFELIQAHAVALGELQELLLRHEPHIVHFSGHGSKTGALVFESDQGRMELASQGALADLFEILGKNIQCILLNACYSENQARAIAAHINCVIGMSSTITDQAATQFALSFYRALGFGKSVEVAFRLARNQLDLSNIPEDDIPQLIHRDSVDPSQVLLRVCRSSSTESHLNKA